MPPLVGCPGEEPAHRIASQPRTCLGDRARRYAEPARVWQRQIELVDDVEDRPVAHHAHANDQPDDLLCREAPTSDRCRARRVKRFLDPVQIEASSKAVELLGGHGSDRLECLAQANGGSTIHPGILILSSDGARFVSPVRLARAGLASEGVGTGRASRGAPPRRGGC